MEKITIFAVGSSQSNPGPATIEVQIVDASGTVICTVSEAIGNATNDYAAYQAVLRGLQMAVEVYGEGTKNMQVEVMLGNEFVKRQLNAECQIREPGLVPYFIEIHNMRVTSFPTAEFIYTQHEFNQDTEGIANKVFSAE